MCLDADMLTRVVQFPHGLPRAETNNICTYLSLPLAVVILPFEHWWRVAKEERTRLSSLKSRQCSLGIFLTPRTTHPSCSRRLGALGAFTNYTRRHTNEGTSITAGYAHLHSRGSSFQWSSVHTLTPRPTTRYDKRCQLIPMDKLLIISREGSFLPHRAWGG